MNLNTYAENFAKKGKTLYISIDPKKKIKRDTVFVMKAKTTTLIVRPKQYFSDFIAILTLSESEKCKNNL